MLSKIQVFLKFSGSEDSVRDGLAVASVVKVHQNHDQSLSLFRKEGDSESTIAGSSKIFLTSIDFLSFTFL